MRIDRSDWIFLGLVALCLPATLVEHGWWKFVVNPIPTVWLARVAWRDTRSRFGSLVFAGVTLGAVGDAFLGPIEPALFVPGALAFLVGHLCYIGAFVPGTTLERGRAWIAVPLLAFALPLGSAVRDAMTARGEGALVPGVAIYGAVLLATTFVGVVRRGRWPVAAGVLVFLVSDAHIAFNNLIFAKPVTVLLFTGMATYYLAQFLIVRGARLEAAAGAQRADPEPILAADRG